MNKRFWFYIIVFCFGYNHQICASVLQGTAKDSLSIDRSNINPRHFEALSEKYIDDAFIYEYSAENSGWWSRFKQWISDFFKSLFDIQNREEANDLTDLLLKIGGVIIFLLVAYFIFKAMVNKEGQWVFGKSSDKNIIPINDIEQNLSIIDFKKLTREAEKNNQYRLAVRYYYLWLLKKLAAAEIIEYDVEKTNSDYQNEISSKHIREDFSYTSYLYNYIWYGEFNVNETQFAKAKHAFINFLNTIKA